MKPVVTFKRTDGKLPSRTPWGFNLRVPFATTVPAAKSAEEPSTVMLDLGLTCDRPLLVWIDRNGSSLQLASGWIALLDAAEPLAVALVNRKMTPVQLTEGSSILRASVLSGDWFDVRIE